MNGFPALRRACSRQKIVSKYIENSRISRREEVQQQIRRATTTTTATATSTSTNVSQSDHLVLANLLSQPPIESALSKGARPSSIPNTVSTTHQSQSPLPASSSTAVQTRSRILTGTITRTGTMPGCVQITHQAQSYDSHLQKYYTRPQRLLVHDPNPAGYLREGDVIEYSAWTGEEKEARMQRKAEVETKIATEAAIAREAEQAAAAAAAQEASEDTAMDKKRNNTGKKSSSTTKTANKPRRRFMTRKPGGANHGTGAPKWNGTRYVVRRVVTPFGTGLDRRMEEVVKYAERNTVVPDAKVTLKGKPQRH